MLEGIDSCTNTMDEPAHLVQVFVNVIDTLDYYEQFSPDEPDYWNALLEIEIAFQKTIVERLIKGEPIALDTYGKKYQNVQFEEL